MKNELESNEKTQQASVKTSADIRVLTPEDRHGFWVTDGDEKFVVPKRYAQVIVQAVPMLRFSFEHIGGRHVGHAPKHAEHEDPTTEPEELGDEGTPGEGKTK